MPAKSTTYTKITARIIALILIFTLSVSYIYGEYIKRNAIETLAQIDARKTSKIVFESYYAAMAKGWNKEDLKSITKRLNAIDDKLTIDIYRGELVAALYGEIEKDKIYRDSLPDVQRAIRGEELLEIKDNDTIEYYYPVFAQNECLKCHVNAQTGNVLGVINIRYPVDEIKISLNQVMNFFMMFMVFFSLIMFFILFINFQKYLLKPIKNFIAVLNTIKESKDIKKRALSENNIEEIRAMQNVFNSMLDSIETQFYNDTLTGLSNRIALLEVLDKEEASLLMLIDIDHFQEINDLYGDKVGDEVLTSLSTYLKELLPEGANLYRLHADEFAYLRTSDMELSAFEELATYLIAKIAKHKFHTLNGEDIHIRVTLGISYGMDLLLPHADIALKIAKKEKKNQLTYDDSMQEKQKYEMNMSWAKRLNQAIEENRVVALYQPIVECSSDRTVKYECLMRIIDDQGQYISPIHFLELSKKNKVYHHLTKAILKETFNAFKNKPYKFSVNLSPEDILEEEITSFIYEELSRSGIGNRMVIEIIESEGIENFEPVLGFIKKIKSYGVEVSIDDFGTGYSNFEYLIQLEVDFIKIDGSMIKNIDTDPNTRMVVQTIVDFATRMGIKTVAEYVYSKEIYEIVKDLGVDYAQGYYFGQPSRRLE